MPTQKLEYKCLLFITAQELEQFKYPPIDEWINKMWYIHLVEHDLPMRRNDVQIHVKTWMK